MSDFQKYKTKIKEEYPEGQKSKRMNVQDFDIKTKMEIKEYDFESISTSQEVPYSERKSKYGPLAATDKDHSSLGGSQQSNKRFSLSPVLRNALSIDQEEQRVIEERVRSRVSVMAAEALAQGAAEGYGEGLKKGRNEAYDQVRKESADRIKAFESVLDEIEHAKERVFKANEKFLLSLIFELAQSVVLRELTTDKEYVERLAIKIIESIGIKENIKIKINKKDSETIDLLKNELTQKISGLNNLTIEVSDQVIGGGCIVETEYNFVNASVETQLNQLKQALLSTGT